jgi:hypothetical protein
MSKAALLALADRVEALTGPCRETECMIWAGVNGYSIEWQGATPSKLMYVPHSGLGIIGWIDPGETQRNFTCNRPDTGPNSIPAYLRSLDAALTLYPELPDTVPSCPRKATAAALRAALTQATSHE